MGSPRENPHSRGEEPWVRASNSSMTGSPPLAWGRVNHVLTSSFYVGITPTRVGKSHDQWLEAVNGEDHPHSRGEETKQILSNQAL